MHLPFERDRSLIAVVVAVLLLSLGVGFAADQVSLRRKSAVERAEALAQNGRFEAAEGVYLELLATRPGDVPLLVAMLDNHDSWLRAASEQSRELLGEEEPTLARSVPVIDESRVDSAFAAPSLSGDARMLVQWWRHVLASTDEPGEREEVVKAATRTPPSPWANRLLGRADDRRGRFAEAAESFAREASAFADRSDDAAAACHIWIDTDDWERLSLALSDERFAQQVPATVHMEEAIHRQAWPAVLRWFFAAQYEKTSLAIVLLVAVSGLVWFVVCALVGRLSQRPGFRIPLFVAALALGVASTYLTVAIGIGEESILHFTEKGQAVADAIYYVFGVGLREELSKAVLLFPLVPIILRFGTRRDALACGSLVGLGFAVEENVGYFHLGLSTALARFLTANFLHLSTTGIVAVAIDDALRTGSKQEAQTDGWTQALPLVVITHGMYDYFLSSSALGGATFVSMLTFVLLARRYVNILRQLPGREGPLLPVFAVGLAVVAGATFVYASTLVGMAHAADAIAAGTLGLGIVALVFVREFGSV